MIDQTKPRLLRKIKPSLAYFERSNQASPTLADQALPNPCLLRYAQCRSNQAKKGLRGLATRHPAQDFQSLPENPPIFCPCTPPPSIPLANKSVDAPKRRFYGKKGIFIDMKKIQPNQTFERLIDYWNGLSRSCGIPRLRLDPETDSYCKAKGKLTRALQKHTEEEITSAMDTYANLFVGRYPIIPKHEKRTPWRVGLAEFFKWNDKGYVDKDKKRVIPRKEENHPLRNAESWFAECLKGPAYVRSAYTRVKKDPNPMTTVVVANHVQKHDYFVYNDLNAPVEKNILIDGAIQIEKYLKDREGRFPLQAIDAGMLQRTEILVHLTNYFQSLDRPIPLNWLVTDITYKKLDQYLIATGDLSEKWVSHNVKNGMQRMSRRDA
jgi:hypothetical protein